MARRYCATVWDGTAYPDYTTNPLVATELLWLIRQAKPKDTAVAWEGRLRTPDGAYAERNRLTVCMRAHAPFTALTTLMVPAFGRVNSAVSVQAAALEALEAVLKQSVVVAPWASPVARACSRVHGRCSVTRLTTAKAGSLGHVDAIAELLKLGYSASSPLKGHKRSVCRSGPLFSHARDARFSSYRLWR